MRRYGLTKGIVFRPELFGGLLFVPHRSLIVELNPSAYKIIQMVAEGSSEEDMVAASDFESSSQIIDFLLKLEQSEIIEEVGVEG